MNIDQLEKLATNATPGPWFGFFDGVRMGPSVFGERNTSRYVAHVLATLGKNELEHANANYIAAANPDAVLALIAVARAADQFMRTGGIYTPAMEPLRAALAALESK